MHISEKIKEVNSVVIEQEDMLMLDHFTSDIKRCADSIAAIEKAASFLQTEKGKKTQENKNLAGLVDDDSIFSGLTSGIGIIASVLASAEWGVKQTLKRSVDVSSLK